MAKHHQNKKRIRENHVDNNKRTPELRKKEILDLRQMAKQAGVANADDLSDRILKLTLGF